MAPTIELSEKEVQLKALLLDVAERIDASSTEVPKDGQTQPPAETRNQPIVLRFTGGWVRDKLLGTESHDVDVAINKMTGYQFGLKMKEYLELPESISKYNLDGHSSSGALHKIEANPEKSKHLETVTTKILGLDVDLVNLRKETYTEDSRNPEMEFGTPQEDALRRDACVNALFYNLNTGEIEDFTERGLDDMRSKLIRTPLEPYQTFKDDPLRVLRLIRFATRLDYAIDPEAQKSMAHQDIKDALRIKISRERVGIELEKMLRGRDPRAALNWIDQLGLYTTVFTDPIANPRYIPELGYWSNIYNYTFDLTSERSSADKETIRDLLRNADDYYQAWISTAMIPWVDAPLPPPPKKNRQPIPLVVTVAQEGFKAPNKVANTLASSIQHLDDIRVLKDKFNTHQRYPNKRREGDDATAPDILGMSIRKWGSTWRQQVLFALLYEIFSSPGSLQLIEKSYINFIQYIQRLKLLDANDMKPLLDGKELSKALSMQPGPWMKDALDVVMAWQLRNPDVKDRVQAIDAVKIHLELVAKNGVNGESPHNLSRTQIDLRDSLIQHFLRNIVRPLFAPTPSNPSVTAEGRQRNQPGFQKQELIFEETPNRPWKSDSSVFPILRWCVSALTPFSTEKHWPLLVPPILAQIDDLDTLQKVRGCALLTTLLTKTPSGLLKRTGLTGVFEDALVPLLSYLPTLTPVEESVQLLNATYPALIQLARTRYHVISRPDDPEAWDAKIKMTSKYIRHGVLHGMAMAGEYPPIAACLLTHLSPLLKEEGIDSVRHLKEVVPMLVETLAQPFALAHVPLCAAAVRALQAVVVTGWPRMEGWKGEILKGLCLLWAKIEEEGKGGPEFEELMAEMRAVAEMLDAALRKTGQDIGLATDAALLIEADDTLISLFEKVRDD